MIDGNMILMLAQHKTELEQIDAIKAKLEAKQNEINAIQEQIATLRGKMDAIQKEMDSLRTQLDNTIASLGAATGMTTEELKALFGVVRKAATRKPRANGLKDKIIQYFSERKGTWVTARTVSQRIEANEGAVLRVLNQLVDEGVLRRDKNGRSYVFCTFNPTLV